MVNINGNFNTNILKGDRYLIRSYRDYNLLAEIVFIIIRIILLNNLVIITGIIYLTGSPANLIGIFC